MVTLGVLNVPKCTGLLTQHLRGFRIVLHGSLENSELIFAQSVGQFLDFLSKFSVKLQFLSVCRFNVHAMGNFLAVVILLADERRGLQLLGCLLGSADVLEHFAVLTSHRVVSGVDLALLRNAVRSVESLSCFNRFFFLSAEFAFLNHGQIEASLGAVSDASESLGLML